VGISVNTIGYQVAVIIPTVTLTTYIRQAIGFIVNVIRDHLSGRGHHFPVPDGVVQISQRLPAGADRLVRFPALSYP
jgi:hypothetical protein